MTYLCGIGWKMMSRIGGIGSEAVKSEAELGRNRGPSLWGKVALRLQKRGQARPGMTVIRLALFVTVLLLQAGPGWAQSESTGVPWDQLSAEEQEVLKPFADRWDQFTPERQARLQKGAGRWGSMGPEERGQARKRFSRWKQLSPEKRARVREKFKRFRHLPPEKRRALREARKKFKHLPPERRRQLRERWRNMSPEQKRKFMRKRGFERSKRQPFAGRPDRPRRHRPGR